MDPLLVSILAICVLNLILNGAAIYISCKAVSGSRSAQDSHNNLVHQMHKESIDRILAATDRAAYWDVQSAESTTKPKPKTYPRKII